MQTCHKFDFQMGKDENWISIREFSRRIGCSDTAVLKAIKAGKITEESIDRTNPKRPLIHSTSALKSWGKNYAPNYNQSDKIEQALKPEKELMLIRPLSKKEQLAEMQKPELPASITNEMDFDGGDQTDDSEEINERPTWVKKGATLNLAKTVEAIHKANLAQIEVLTAKGKLISRSKAEKQFYDAGIVIRSKLQGIPDKLIDLILACDDRMEAHTILYNGITEALEDLAALKL